MQVVFAAEEVDDRDQDEGQIEHVKEEEGMLIFHPSERGHPSHERPRTVNPVVELGAGVQIPVGVYGVEVHHEKSKGEVQQDQLDEG